MNTTLPDHPDPVDPVEREWLDFIGHDAAPTAAVTLHRLRVLTLCRARRAARMNGDRARRGTSPAPRRARARARRTKPARAADDGEPARPSRSGTRAGAGAETLRLIVAGVAGPVVVGERRDAHDGRLDSGGATPKGGGNTGPTEGGDQ